MHKLTVIFVSLAMCGLVLADNCPSMYEPNPLNASITHSWCLVAASNFTQSYPITATDQATILDKHNDYRKAENATDMLKMSWDADLAKIAESWTEQCLTGHDENDARALLFNSTGGKFKKRLSVGQNMWYADTTTRDWAAIVTSWHAEIKDFNYNVPTAETIGHYTQVVWAKSSKIGCSMTHCGDTLIALCNYGPAGNMMGELFTPFKEGQNCECDTCDNDGFCVCDKVCVNGASLDTKKCECNCVETRAWINADCSYDCSKVPAVGSCGWEGNLPGYCGYSNVMADCPTACSVC